MDALRSISGWAAAVGRIANVDIPLSRSENREVCNRSFPHGNPRAEPSDPIGRGSIIGDNALLDARNGLTLGNNVNLSSNVSIYTLQHDHRDPEFGCYENQPEKKLSVEVDDRAWIGSNVTVLPGVHIGEGAVCCAGCVVTKDVEPYAIVAGIPARKVGERTRDLTYELRERSCAFY